MRRHPLLAAALLVLFAAAVGGAIAAPAAAPPLRLRYLELPAAVRGPALAALPAPAGRLIVQFAGPVGPAERAALAATGAKPLDYLPDYAFLVEGAPQELAAAAALPGLARALPAPAALALDLALLRAVADGMGAGPLRLVAWPGREAQLAAELAAAGVDPSAPLSAAALRGLAGLPSLRWAEPAASPRLLNDVGRAIMHVDAGAWAARGLYGEGQILAIADSGLDTGDPATLSADFAGRVVATHVLSPTGDLEDEHGHGTHVAGSALGSGVLSGADPAAGEFADSSAGVAPRASLVFQAFEADAAGQIYGLPDDYYALFAQAYASGARLHNNSWGDPTGPPDDPEAVFGGYPAGSQRADAFVWEHPDMALFFAAGNSGSDGAPDALGFCTGDGVIDPDSLYAPGTAKNVITVGASESTRGGTGLGPFPWLLLNFCFAAQPIATDTLANNANGMAAFSSRGPTDDGRVKPDLVAPGTNILSSRSHAPGAGALWGPHETNQDYVYSGGTSMATPLVAGAGALVREWLVEGGAASPSAALIKAVLLNTARDISPGQYGGGATQEIPNTWPNSVAGWGRADLGFLGAAAPFAIWHDDHADGLTTGAAADYSHSAGRPLEVTSSSLPLRVHLVWTDPPAALGAARQLVNDLDLTVTGPDGTVFRGNGAADGDRLNNVEGVLIPAPAAGRYTVEVRGVNVPVAEQPFALVVSGPLRSADGEPQPQTISFPAPTGLRYGSPPVTLAATASSGLPVNYELISGPGALSGSALTITGAGEVRVRASQAGNAGYAPASAEVSIAVAKAPLTATADDKERAVGQPNPPLTLSYGGFIGDDSPADLDEAPAASAGATAASPPGDYPIVVSGGADDNYAISGVPGVLRVVAGPEPPEYQIYLPLLRR